MTFRAPRDAGLREALYRVCEGLRAPNQSFTPELEVPLKDVGVEFIGRRSGAQDQAAEPQKTEEDKLKALESECKSDMTILYIHGGGLLYVSIYPVFRFGEHRADNSFVHSTSSPAEYRAASTRLARMTNARVASVRYRLAPANTFPAPILDILVAYASLIYPPPGSHHKPVNAEHIVLAGNSAGGNLCFALTKFLLELRRNTDETSRPDSKIAFHGSKVSLPMPAGIATCSSWCDQCDALPSWQEGGKNDILTVLQPALLPGYPTDDLWPSKPPREHPYCAAATLDHELVSPAAVKDWTGAPPMWFSCGSEERGLDGNKVVASQAAKCGVPVLWNEYAGMPHEFVVLMARMPQALHCLNAWADACSTFANGQIVQSRGRILKMPDCEEVEIGNVAELTPLPFDEVRRRMKKRNRERKVWTGAASSKLVYKSNL